MRKTFLTILLLFLFLAVNGKEPKYIFLFIGDGMSIPQRMIADEFARKIGRDGIIFNRFPYQATTRTCSANQLVTDSAAAATAIACGEKTDNGVIGLSSGGKTKLTSVAEVARDKQRKVGILTSVTLNHATPAGFYGHRKSRAQYYELGLDLLSSGFDFFGGGGIQQHDNRKSPAYKGDILKIAAQSGYSVYFGKEGLKNMVPGKKSIIIAGKKGDKMAYAIDEAKNEPTLAEITEKAIAMLDNPKGFFMMVEGGAIDYAGHANDAATNLREVLALDDAVRVACKFYQAHPGETLIIVTGDHETGGMTMGFAGSGNRMFLERLNDQKCSLATFDAMLKQKPDLSFDEVKTMLSEYFGFKYDGSGPMRISDKELAQLQTACKEKKLSRAVRVIVSRRAGVGWGTGSHTSLPVLTTAVGAKAELFSGFMENTEISRRLKGIL